jgi:hypothetical protein
VAVCAWAYAFFYHLTGAGAVSIPVMPRSDQDTHLNYNDLKIGLPNMLFEVEIIQSSLFFMWAFNITRYR